MRVAVTGYCACNGLGRTTAEVLRALASGRRGLGPCPLDVPFAGVCGSVADPLPPVPPELEPWSTRQLRIGLLALTEIAPAVRDAIDRHGADRVGMVLGTSTGGIEAAERAYFHWRKTGKLPPDYYFFTQHPFHAFGEAIASLAGIRGPSWVVSTACSSSAKVFGSARRLLRAGRCDAVLVGGVDSLALTTVRGFHSLSAASPLPCRPFSAERAGMNVGEGAAFVLLERDGSGPAELLGIGESSDAFHMSAPDPEGRGAAAAMRRALDDASLAPDAIDYVNAHGTATERNDVVEAKAIAQVLGTNVPVVSTKSYTGHLLGAAGATEAVFTIAAIEHGWIPGNLDVDPVDPEVAVTLPRARTELAVRNALSTSFAFGGSNAALVFGGPR